MLFREVLRLRLSAEARGVLEDSGAEGVTLTLGGSGTGWVEEAGVLRVLGGRPSADLREDFKVGFVRFAEREQKHE